MDKLIRKKMLAVILTLAMVVGLVPALTLSVEAADHAVTLTDTATAGTFFHITATDLFGSELATNDSAFVGFTRPVLTGSDPAVYGDIAYQEGTPYIGADGTIYGSISGMSVVSYADYYFIADTPGTYTFTAYYDNEVALYIDNYNVTLSVQSPAVEPVVTTAIVSTYTATSATLGGSVTDDGGAAVTDRGVVYSATDATPRIGESGVTQDSNGNGTGDFSESVTGFLSGTTYYVCAYATNTAGTSYGSIVSFTTTAYWKDNAATGYAGGSGTSTSPYQISTAEQLAYFSNQVNAGTNYNSEYFELTDDINLSGKLWTPIGNSSSNPFKGTFNGNGHVISALDVSVSGAGAWAGLFGLIDSGTVKNVGVKGTVSATSTGSSYSFAGGLVGDNEGAIINCYSQVNVTSTAIGTASYAGGLAGGTTLGTVTNCYATGNVSSSGTTSYAGVLCGEAPIACNTSYYNSEATVAGTNSGIGTSMTSALMKEASFVSTLNTYKESEDNGWAAVTGDYPTFASLPTVTLSVDNASIAENGGSATVTATLSNASPSDVTVTLGYTGTATGNGTDYTASSTTITITAGNTSGTATITAANDALDEADETVIVDITGVTNGTESGTQQQTVTITDDDNAPTISVNDASVTEGNSGTVTLTFTVSLSAASGKTVTVDYATANGTATAGTDYTAKSGTLTFSAGDTSKTVDVTVAGDTVTEPNESLFLNLTNASNATIADNQGVGTITNDDAIPAISVGDPSVTEGDSGTKTLTFTVSLDHASTSSVTVDYATADDTATAGTDYTAASGTLTFSAGDTSKTVDVTIAGDSVYEPDESFFLNLTNAVNATISDAQGVGTITNDDDAPTVTLSVDNASIAEDGGSATVTATLSNLSTSDVTVTLDYTGTATGNGTDYTASSTTITITAGNTSGTATITAANDALDEADETVIVDITEVTNGTENGTQQRTVTITDDDDAPTLSVNDPSVTEGNSGTVTLTFTVTLSAVSGKTVTVDYATANGTATAGTDYTATSGTLTFSAGDTSKTVSVTVAGDTVTESDETVLLNLSNALNATISDDQGSGTITNDDAIPAISVGDPSVTEGDSGTKTLTFTVSLDHASASSVTVDYATADDTATAGTDYTAASGTLTFSAGDTSKTVDVTIAGDSVYEPDESFFLNLTNAVNATISDAQGVGTITNDDDAPTVTLSVDNASIAEDGGSATVTATLSNLSTSDVTVTLDYTGTATGNGTDYTASSTTITITAGNTSGTATITAANDALDEADETVIVDITEVTNGTENGTQQRTVTITDDDDAPTISVNNPSVVEGDSKTKTLTFTVTLSAASGKTVTVDYATANGSATAGKDYTATSGTLTFSAGDTSKTVSVTVTGDTVIESDEKVLLNLSNALNATISDAQGSGTIRDDDTPVYDDDTTGSNHNGASNHDGAEVQVNGELYTAGTSETGTNEDGQTQTTVTVDTDKLQDVLESQGTGAMVTIPILTDSEVLAGVLTGDMVKNMENKDATLVVQTESGTYTLPASEISIDAVSEQLGSNVSLSDISVTISISEPSASMTQVVENAAGDGGFTIMVPAVDYTITCTYGDQMVNVSSFNSYVERTIAMPDGVDPEKITTGIVVEPDGTVHHVPTRITVIGGKYYAVIKSLTNSTYSVVWNPVEFTDMMGHWAKDAVNDMGSRMVVTGVGDNNYAPDRDITRAEFAAIMVRALGLVPGTGASGFSDVSQSDWFCGYIRTASEYGLISGYPDGTFGPNDKITREQAMTVTASAMKITGLEASLSADEVADLLTAFTDSVSVSSYADENVAACVSAGIVTGREDNTIAPQNNITRAEVAVMIERLLQKAELI